ncbi:MAG TPA: glycosyltransferase family A protein [Acidimicrobiales bacterium]
MTTAEILVPTHDHARTLGHSLRSAQAQTVEDIRIVVIGDGIGDDTRDVVADVAADDRRVELLDLPKAGRTGEPHRDPVVRGSTAAMVTYLCDDDLLFADHVERMLELLGDADVALPPSTHLDVEGTVHCSPVSLADEEWREVALEGRSLYGLTGLSHTTEAYRRLPEGWTTTPEGFYTDQYMLLKFLRLPGCRFVGGDEATTVYLPSPPRKHMSDDDRAAELDRVVAWLGSGGWDQYRRAARAGIRRIASRYQLDVPRLRAQRDEAVTYAQSLRSHLERAHDELAALRAEQNERTATEPSAPEPGTVSRRWPLGRRPPDRSPG